MSNNYFGAFFALVMLSACSDQRVGTLPYLPEDEPCRIDVSDTSAFAGVVTLQIVQSDSGARVVALDASAGSIDARGSFGMQVILTDDQVRNLASGSAISMENGERVHYPIGGTDVNRALSQAQLSLQNSTATLTLQLGATVESGTFAPTAVATVRGQISVSCNVTSTSGAAQGDPTFSTEFCSTARSELGLSTWINTVR